MFAFLEGSLAYKSPSLVYLNVGGLGYELNITLHTYSHIQDMEHCRLYVHLQVREDAWVLYGWMAGCCTGCAAGCDVGGACGGMPPPTDPPCCPPPA